MPSTPQDKLENADLQWQDSGAPYSTHFDDIYFSRDGGLEETEHVFLAGNQLATRWADADHALVVEKGAAQRHFTVAELGFGTGLNFLCCWRAWQELAPQQLRLHYIACEKYPLRIDALRQALQEWPELAPYSEALLHQYPDHSAAYHRLHLHFAADKAPITLDLYYGDATQTLEAQPEREFGKIDAWFLDGFAPRVNPKMWSEELLAQIARLSRPGTTLSTYSVAGQVVRGLKAAGFEVKKVAGFGSKRQMLTGHFPQTSGQQAAINLPKKSWFDLAPKQAPCSQAIIIGAGMAGCAAAHSLARKGIKVLVLEQAGVFASGASGNRQAVLQCRLSNALNGSRQFNLQAFLYAAREFAQLDEQFPSVQWQACGVMNLDTSFSKRKERCLDVDLDQYAPLVARRLDQNETNQLAGVVIDGASTYLRMGGWLRPTQLCQAYLAHPNIELQCNTEVIRLERAENLWHVYSSAGKIASAAAVIIANSHSASRLAQTAPLPIVPIKGQVSYLRATEQSRNIARVICGQSYISPVFEGLHSVGASYSKNITDLEISEREHLQNIEGIAHHLAINVIGKEAIESGRVSIRATTSDRMPIVGPVPNFAAFEALYSKLGQGARKHAESNMPYLEGLFVSVGHGSHGLSNAPLCGEYLASVIANEMLPLQRKVLECAHPGRFFLRELRRRDYPH